MSGIKNENDTALVNLENLSLDIDKTHRDSLVYVLKQNFSKTNPIDKKVFSKMMKKPNNAAEILNEKINKMKPKEKKLFLTILEFYSDAYQSADDNTTSMFNKTQLLTSSLRLTVLPMLYDGIKKTPTDLRLINERNNVGNQIVSDILTSLSYENGSVQLKTHYQECANPM